MKILVHYRHNGIGAREDAAIVAQPETSDWPHTFIWEGDVSQKIRCCAEGCAGEYRIGYELHAFAKSNASELESDLFCRCVNSGFALPCSNSLHYRFQRLPGDDSTP